MTIDFTPDTPTESNPTEINFQPGQPLPSISTAAARSYMFQQGLNPVLQRDREDIHAAIASGKEDSLRTEAASGLDALKIRLKQNAARIIGQIPDPSGDAIKKIAEKTQPTDPSTVAEEAWGQNFQQQVSQAAYGNMKDTTYAQAIKDYPRIVEDVKRRGGIIAAQNQVVQKWAQNAQDTINKQGYYTAGAERGLQFIPGYTDILARAAFRDVLPGLEKLGFGDYMAEASRRLLTMPFPQFSQTMDNIFGPLIEKDPHLASYLLSQIIGQSATDRVIGDFSTALDVTALPGLGAIAKGVAARFMKEAGEVTGDAIHALQTPERVFKGEGAEEAGWSNIYEPGTEGWYKNPEIRTAEAAGDMKEAGVQKAATEIKEITDGTVNQQKSDVDRLTANFRLDLDNFTANIGAGGRELKNRIVDRFKAVDGEFRETLGELRRVETLSDVQASNTLARMIEKTIKENYRGVNNMVGDVKYMGLDPLKNTYRYEIHYFSPDGQPFAQNIQALTNKNLNGLLDAKVVKEGMGWKLVREINLDENMRGISDLIASTDEGKLQKTWFDGWADGLNRYRTPKETLSVDENAQRRLATSAPDVLLGVVEKELRPYAKVPKGIPFTNTRKKWRQFQQAVEHSKHEIDPQSGIPGKWFDNGADMDKFYLQNFNRLPDDIEKEAYVARVRAHEMDRVYNTIRLYDNKAKWGAEQHRIYVYDESGKKQYSDFFEGRQERDTPFRVSADATVYVQIGKGPGVVYRWGSNNPIAKKIESGELKAVQIWNPDYRPLASFAKTGQGRIQWVISRQFETKPLDWENQIPRRGGGHFVYNYNYYIKQAKITRETIRGAKDYHWLEGDTTVMPISIRAMGNDIVKHLNAVREHLLNGREDLAKAYHYTNKLPMGWDEHLGWYKESNPGGVYKPARLSMREPIHLVPKDLSVADMPGALEAMEKRYGTSSFKDSTREGNPSRQHQVQFTGERDVQELYSINDIGSRRNPLYSYEPAAFADPIHTMNRALTSAVKSIYNADMKTYSMTHWLKQAEPYIDAEVPKNGRKLDTLLGSPSWHFNNTKWLAGTDPQIIKKLESAQYQMKQFIGIPNDQEAYIHGMMQKTADMLYEKGFKAVPEWMMHEVQDPLAFMRSMIVHMKLGLFNPTAFFVQASTHLNIWGIAGPQHAAPGTIATMLDRWSLTNRGSKIIDALGKKAEGMGWKPGEWKEAWEELNRRGFRNIGHTHAFTDAPYQTKVIRTKFGEILDWGHFPFREGAQSVRTAAWYTAYHEWRRGAPWSGGAHPTGKLSKQDWDRVGSRADDLDHNMSRAGNSAIQSGLMSFPMQFQSYHLRLLELMTGKRLTTAEKARLFAAQTLFYGIPIGGIGLTLPVIGPYVTESINRHAQEMLGYIPNDHFVSDVVMRGLPDAILGVIFGEQYNIGERWGPGKFNPLQQFVEGSPDWWGLLTGATGSTFRNIAVNSTPMAKAAMAFITGHSDDFKLTAEDMLRPLEQVSSISNIAGFIRTVETGRMLSQGKAESFQSDVSQAKWRQAFMRYVVGLTPESVVSSRSNHEWYKAERDDFASRLPDITREVHAMLDARNNNDPEAEMDHQKRAMSFAGDMPERDRLRAWNDAYRSYNKPLDQSSEEQRFLHAPKGQEEIRKEMLRKLQQQRQQRQGR